MRKRAVDICAEAPELLAPVGDMAMCRAAVHAGADAIYVGVPEFNARGRAPSLSHAELGEIVEYCHQYGVRVFFALNILIFEAELWPLFEQLPALLKLNPDAFIVQDIGLCIILHTLAPHVAIHASTQMTITSSEGIQLTAPLGIARYVLGRENSLRDIARIREDSSSELEVFVHGALCVSYSGQCLTSESFGGRSANRGQCAQSCRLPYELLVDGKLKELGENRYLVSPQDLCGLAEVTELKNLGVNSLKIEGRLKSPEYVASTTAVYREALAVERSRSWSAAKAEQLAPIYSRGFFSGWLNGVDHQRLVDGRISSHHGLELGQVAEIKDGKVTVSRSSVSRSSATQSLGSAKRKEQLPALELRPGDGVVFVDLSADPTRDGTGNGSECGGVVYEVALRGSTIELAFANDFVDRYLTRQIVRPGMVVFWNSAPHSEREWQRLWTERERVRRIPIVATASGQVGEPLKIDFSDNLGNQAFAFSESPLASAKSAPLTAEAVEAECSALAATVFKLMGFEWRVQGTVFLHSKELRRVRQEAISKLEQARQERYQPALQIDAARELILTPAPGSPVGKVEPAVTKSEAPQLSVLLRSAEQVPALIGPKVDLVYLDFEYGRDYTAAVTKLRQAGYRIGLATTRIHKPRENAHLSHLAGLRPDVVLVRNLGALHYFQQLLAREDNPSAERNAVQLVGDFSLNVTNHLTLDWFIGCGLTRLVPSYDLNLNQLQTLLETGRASYCEIPIHHYIAAFHMEHCVFARCLSSGSSYRDCGRPCERHRVQLRDRLGKLHPLHADAECRNTMFNGVPQSAVRFVPEWRELGVNWFRIEALWETGVELRKKVDLYANVLAGKLTSEDAYQQLNAHFRSGKEGDSPAWSEDYGVTEGQLINFKTHQNRKKSSDVSRSSQDACQQDPRR